jgi:hypothetical protein
MPELDLGSGIQPSTHQEATENGLLRGESEYVQLVIRGTGGRAEVHSALVTAQGAPSYVQEE